MKRLVLIVCALACVIGPAKARGFAGFSGFGHGGSHKTWAPDGRVGRFSRTYNWTTGTSVAWAKSGKPVRMLMIYPKRIMGTPSLARSPSRVALDALAAAHPQ